MTASRHEKYFSIRVGDVSRVFTMKSNAMWSETDSQAIPLSVIGKIYRDLPNDHMALFDGEELVSCFGPRELETLLYEHDILSMNRREVFQLSEKDGRAEVFLSVADIAEKSGNPLNLAPLYAECLKHSPEMGLVVSAADHVGKSRYWRAEGEREGDEQFLRDRARATFLGGIVSLPFMASAAYERMAVHVLSSNRKTLESDAGEFCLKGKLSDDALARVFDGIDDSGEYGWYLTEKLYPLLSPEARDMLREKRGLVISGERCSILSNGSSFRGIEPRHFSSYEDAVRYAEHVVAKKSARMPVGLADDYKIDSATRRQNENLQMVLNDPMALSRIPDHEIDAFMCINAVARDGMALEYVPSRYRFPGLEELAVQKNPMALRFVDERDINQNMAILAIYKNPEAVRLIPPKMMTERIAVLALQQNANMINELPVWMKNEYGKLKVSPATYGSLNRIRDLCVPVGVPEPHLGEHNPACPSM